MPEAAVMLTNRNTNTVSKTKTNEAGFYTFPGTLPGPYQLAAEASGMHKFEGTLGVPVQETAGGHITLQGGTTAWPGGVQDVAPLVQTGNPALGHTLERTRIEQLPINGRALTTLLQ